MRARRIWYGARNEEVDIRVMQGPDQTSYAEFWGSGELAEKMLQIGNNNFHAHGDLERVFEEKLREAVALDAVIRCRPEEIGVEIGTGLGVHSRYFAMRCRHLHTVDVTDQFGEQVAVLLAGLANVTRHIRAFFPVLDAIEDASVDFVYASSVFCHLHVYDIFLYFEEIASKLRPGGRFYVNFQNADSNEFDDFFMQYVETYRRSGVFAPMHPGQMQFHSNRYFRNVADRFGLEVVHERVAGHYSEFVFARRAAAAAPQGRGPLIDT